MRAFIAVEIDQPNKQKLLNLISDLKKSNADVRWVNENQMHLTLKFLGNIEEGQVRQISGALKSTAENFNAFSIRLTKVGAFPDLRRPRVIWIGLNKGKAELKSLSVKIETDMEKLGFAPSTSLGTSREKREFKAHLTLGRVRSLKNIENLEKIINEVGFQAGNDIRIDKIILFQSTLTPKGAIYTNLSEHPIKNP